MWFSGIKCVLTIVPIIEHFCLLNYETLCPSSSFSFPSLSPRQSFCFLSLSLAAPDPHGGGICKVCPFVAGLFCLLNCLQVYLCYNLLRKFLLCRNSISLHIPYGFLIRSSDRYLITSVVWLSNTAQDTDVWVSALIPAFRFRGKNLQVELIDWSVSAWFFSGALICFPYKMAILFHIPVSSEQGLQYFHILTSVYFPFFFHN